MKLAAIRTSMSKITHGLVLFFTTRVFECARIGLEVSKSDMELLLEGTEKTGSGDSANVYITFNSSYQDQYGHHPNDIGRLRIRTGGGAQLTNQGFATSSAIGWRNGMILGKADDYVWPIPPDSGYDRGLAFTFDHGASDLVFGDTIKQGTYRPEFEEIIYIRNDNSLGATQTPQDALLKQLREEEKESLLKVGEWNKLGYLHVNKASRGGGNTIRYIPRLKLKDIDQRSFASSKLGGIFSTTTLVRPSILDIDNLFAIDPSVPSFFRSVRDVENDPAYHGRRASRAYSFGRQASGSRQSPYEAYNMSSGVYNISSVISRSPRNRRRRLFSLLQSDEQEVLHPGIADSGTVHPGIADSGPANQRSRGGSRSSRGAARGGNSNVSIAGSSGRNPGIAESSEVHPGIAESPEARSGEDRPSGGHADIANSPQRSSVNGSTGMSVEIDVDWLTPVLQKFQCVSVADQYAKVGGDSLYIAMGWDTESGPGGQELDLDLSLIPFDRRKMAIRSKMVYYNAKTPHALSCGAYGDYGMRAFKDDQDGEEPGDDELVKINLGCINRYHSEIDSIVVIVNIYKPVQLSWNQIDSAYMRIISGGKEDMVSGNFFIRGAEAVRSFVRLTGNDLKSDPELSSHGLAVGVFFRQHDGEWAFANLNSGVHGRNAPTSIPHLQNQLQDLVYPASQFWDRTSDHQALRQTGAFGHAGIYAKGMYDDQIGRGELPCIARRQDQANIHFGRLTPDALRRISEDERYGQYGGLQNKAQALLKNEQLRGHLQGFAQKVHRLEHADTLEERRKIAQTDASGSIAPTQEDSDSAESSLKSLFGIV